jgi:uncharacterized membrane protein YkoI
MTKIKTSASAIPSFFVGVAFLLSSTQAFALTGSQYSKEAKVTLQQARQIAQKECQGKIVSQELEKEKGGSGLRYSFDIKKGKTVQEVGVDAKTGKVLENSPEGPHAD